VLGNGYIARIIPVEYVDGSGRSVHAQKPMSLFADVSAKGQSTWSLSHSDNECQWSINNCWLCILGYLSGDWMQTSIHEVLAAFRG